MNFKFMHSKIDTRTAVPTLSEWVKVANTQKAMEKTASTQAPVQKTAKIPDFIQEKIDAREGKKKGDKGEKEEDDDEKDEKKPCDGKKTAATEDGKSSGQPEAEAKLVNDPHADPKLKEGKGGKSGKSDKGEGESSGQLDVEPLHQEGESTGKEKKDEKKAAAATAVKTARFQRIGELTDKQKEFLRRVWSNYWPKSFIDAVLAKK